MPKEMPVPWADGILAGCSIPVPPPWRRHHIPQELSARVVPSTVTGAGPAAIRCLAFVQRTALVKIKGLFHYSGSPSNYAPVISCGSLRAIQAALGWVDVALSPGEPLVAAALSLGRTKPLVALERAQCGRGHFGATALGSGAGAGVLHMRLSRWSSSAQHHLHWDIRHGAGRGDAGVTSPARPVRRFWETRQEVAPPGATGKLPN